MKKNLFFLAIVVVLFTSCKKDSDDNTNNTPVYTPPTIEFTNTSGYLSQDMQWPCDSSFRVGIHAASDAHNGTKLVHFSIVSQYNTKVVTYLDSTFEATTFDYEARYYALGEPGSQQWIFKTTDSRGEIKETTLTVTAVKQ